VTLLGLPQCLTEGIKSLGAPLRQQVEEFHILAETAHFGLRYRNKKQTHIYLYGYNSIFHMCFLRIPFTGKVCTDKVFLINLELCIFSVKLSRIGRAFPFP
jgi:hypothetical protein